MKNFNEYMLPLGSVVTCKMVKEKYRDSSLFVITNRIIFANGSKNKFFDYEGYYYPGGTLKDERIKLNHEDVNEIIHVGYKDEKEKEYLDGMFKFVKSKNLKKKKMEY